MTKTFADVDIDTRGRTGNVKTTCPQCSHTRKKPKDLCLSVNTDEGLWNCHHCDWSGSLKESGDGGLGRSKKTYRRPTYQPTDQHHDTLVAWFQDRDIAQELYPTKFTPTLWPKKIGIPRLMTPPDRAKHEIGYKNVFVCSMADLFGKWVPKEWIDAILEECRNAPEWNFLFLTKFPSRMAEFEFADNMWVGTTVDCQARVPEAEKAFRKIKAKVKWLSCEPLIDPLKFTSLEMFDWLVVGGASASRATAGTKATPDYIPPSEWLGNLYVQAAKAGLKVYEKTNGRPREYPGFEYKTAPKAMRYLPDKGVARVR